LGTLTRILEDLYPEAGMGFAGRCVLSLTLLAGALAMSPQGLRADEAVLISGTVFGLNDERLGGADVYARTALGTVSSKADKHGNFVMLGFSGQSLIVIRASGHAPCVSQVSLNAGDHVRAQFHLEPGSVSGAAMWRLQHCARYVPESAFDRSVIE
jgi:hypothetical protein